MSESVQLPSNYTHLHFYQCSWCKTTATSAIYQPEHPPKCGACLRYMARLYTEPITTDQQRELASRGIVFNPYTVRGPVRKMCDVCRSIHDADEMVRLGAGGTYCSSRCAEIGTERHYAAMDRILARVAKVKEDNPWLK